MNSLKFATIQEIRSLIDTKQITVSEVLDFYLGRFAEIDPKIKSTLDGGGKCCVSSGHSLHTYHYRFGFFLHLIPNNK